MGAVIVTGIPGVGKSTVMEAAARAHGLRVAVYGTVMFETAQASGLAASRDDMRRLPPAVQKGIQRQAAAAIAAMGDVVVDTHCSIKTPSGYLPGLPAWVLEALQPSAIVLVEADPQEILARRQADPSRRRDEDSLAAIEEHQEYNRRFAAACATLTGATVHTVRNRDGQVEASVREMAPVFGGAPAGAGSGASTGAASKAVPKGMVPGNGAATGATQASGAVAGSAADAQGRLPQGTNPDQSSAGSRPESPPVLPSAAVPTGTAGVW